MNHQTTTHGGPEVVTVTLNPAIDRTVTISEFAAGKVNRVEQVESNPGGKGVNVAAALSDYGHRVAVTGLLGRDNSAVFESLFAEKGIEDRFVRLRGQTRVGIKITDPVLRQTTDINFPGLAPEPADVAALFDQLARMDSAWVVLAGSLPPGIDATIYHELVARLKAQGCKVALDSSGDALRHAIEAAPDIVKPNIHELEALLGESLPDRGAVVSAARGLIERGIALVVVSMGSKGALFVTADRAVAAQPPRITVSSTVGAGDAMVAGVVAAQLRGLSLPDTARLATAFSVDAISRISSGISSPVAIESLMSQVTIDEL
jgi:1-phosphofructokinase